MTTPEELDALIIEKRHQIEQHLRKSNVSTAALREYAGDLCALLRTKELLNEPVVIDEDDMSPGSLIIIHTG